MLIRRGLIESDCLELLQQTKLSEKSTEKIYRFTSVHIFVPLPSLNGINISINLLVIWPLWKVKAMWLGETFVVSYLISLHSPETKLARPFTDKPILKLQILQMLFSLIVVSKQKSDVSPQKTPTELFTHFPKGVEFFELQMNTDEPHCETYMRIEAPARRKM